MTTGIQNVNNLFGVYHTATLLILLLIALYDARYHKIRNAALLAFLPWCLFSLPISICVNPDLSWLYALLRCYLGFLIGFCVFLFISLATSGSIGGGDIKLVGLLGIIYGATGLMAVLALSCLLVLLRYFLHLLLKRSPKESIPFAPYLFLGCSIYILPQLFTSL